MVRWRCQLRVDKLRQRRGRGRSLSVARRELCWFGGGHSAEVLLVEHCQDEDIVGRCRVSSDGKGCRSIVGEAMVKHFESNFKFLCMASWMMFPLLITG